MKRLILALSLALLWAAPASAQSFNAQEQAEIRAVVREYLVNNPDVLREAMDALEVRANAQRWQRAKGDARDFSIGPADAPITVVEFFDYRCPYCHAAYEWVREMVQSRSDVRLVLKELPILGEASMEASRASVAAMPQGRYWAFHGALITYRGDLTSEAIDRLARESGIDVARMRRAMESPEITAFLDANRGLAVEYEMSGTPGFLINGEMVAGFNRELLEARLREAGREAAGRRRSR